MDVKGEEDKHTGKKDEEEEGNGGKVGGRVGGRYC